MSLSFFSHALEEIPAERHHTPENPLDSIATNREPFLEVDENKKSECLNPSFLGEEFLEQ